jgi:hypothetical protein
MPFIRLLNIKYHYSITRKRFASLAFRPSNDGSGISVVKKECADERSGSICIHAENHYAGTAGTPIVFWPIPDERIPEGCKAVHSVSGTDRWCHYNLIGWNEKDAEDTIKRLPISEARICTENGIRELAQEDLPVREPA